MNWCYFPAVGAAPPHARTSPRLTALALLAPFGDVDALQLEDYRARAIVAAADHLVLPLHPSPHNRSALQARVDVARNGIPRLGAVRAPWATGDGVGVGVGSRQRAEAALYKLPVLFCLYLDGTTRYNELKRKLAPATYKSLTSALRGLVADGLVNRVEYPQVPPKVEYSLTERGLSLMPVLDELCLWGKAHRDDRVPSSDW